MARQNKFVFYIGYILFCVVLCCSCISVKMNSNSNISKSKEISFTPPKAPYKDFGHSFADKAWENKRNGNSISFLSQCNGNQIYDLKDVRMNSLSGIQNIRILNEVEKDFNNRTALFSQIEGSIEGVALISYMVLFNKHDCLYNITYISVKATFKQDSAIFEEFLKGFKIQ